jgi:hypothetical protein
MKSVLLQLAYDVLNIIPGWWLHWKNPDNVDVTGFSLEKLCVSFFQQTRVVDIE